MGLDVIWLLVITDVPWRGVMQCLLLLGQDESRSAVKWNVLLKASRHYHSYQVLGAVPSDRTLRGNFPKSHQRKPGQAGTVAIRINKSVSQ